MKRRAKENVYGNVVLFEGTRRVNAVPDHMPGKHEIAQAWVSNPLWNMQEAIEHYYSVATRNPNDY